ncbi:MAG TPA: TlpA disulfide reductase family protein [Myxococcota bacterium]|nr:TlpA disulfide reductase family protein [Myxococcota bacterium]
MSRARFELRARRLALAIGMALLPALGCGAQQRDEARGEQPEVAAAEKPAKPAPSFALPGLDGSTIALADQRGKPVVIDFWATWCVPCLYQVPELNEFWKKHRERGDVAVIGVAVDVEGASVVGPWIEEQGVEYAIALGDERLAREFGVMGFPTLAIVRPDGNIDSLHVGLIEVEELEKLVAPYLDRGASRQPAP